MKGKQVPWGQRNRMELIKYTFGEHKSYNYTRTQLNSLLFLCRAMHASSMQDCCCCSTRFDQPGRGIHCLQTEWLPTTTQCTSYWRGGRGCHGDRSMMVCPCTSTTLYRSNEKLYTTWPNARHDYTYSVWISINIRIIHYYSTLLYVLYLPVYVLFTSLHCRTQS